MLLGGNSSERTNGKYAVASTSQTRKRCSMSFYYALIINVSPLHTVANWLAIHIGYTWGRHDVQQGWLVVRHGTGWASECVLIYRKLVAAS